MTSIVIDVLVISLLLPGLALLCAVVLRFLLRGAPRRPARGKINGQDRSRAGR